MAVRLAGSVQKGKDAHCLNVDSLDLEVEYQEWSNQEEGAWGSADS